MKSELDPQAADSARDPLVIFGADSVKFMILSKPFGNREIQELQPDFDKLSGLVPAIAQDVETGES